jgi:hypothetical protein
LRRRANQLNELLKGDQIPLYSPAIEPQSGSLRQPKAEAEGPKHNAEEASDTEATDGDQKFCEAFDPSICGVAPSSTGRSGGRMADCPSRSQARPCEARKDIAGAGLASNRIRPLSTFRNLFPGRSRPSLAGIVSIRLQIFDYKFLNRATSFEGGRQPAGLFPPPRPSFGGFILISVFRKYLRIFSPLAGRIFLQFHFRRRLARFAA